MDLYAVLKVEKTASPDEIRKAYKAMALQWHPDKNDTEGAAQTFKQISEAFAVLSDAERRRVYDTHGVLDPSDIPRQTSVFDFHSMFAMFNDSQGFVADSDVIDLNISLKDIKDGCVKHIEYEQPDKCSACDGCGHETYTRCGTCGGSGRTSMMQIPGTPIIVHIPSGGPCIACKGTGTHFRSSSPCCKECSGKGVIYKKRSYDIRIPPGVMDGHMEVIRSRGDRNVAIRICHRFEPGVSLDLESGNVSMTMDLTLEEVLCGYEKDVKLSHIDTVTLTSRGYRSPDDVIVVEGAGLAQKGSCLNIKFRVVYPTTDAALETLVKYREVLRRVYSGQRSVV